MALSHQLEEQKEKLRIKQSNSLIRSVQFKLEPSSCFLIAVGLIFRS
jgi:hypothetical protein